MGKRVGFGLGAFGPFFGLGHLSRKNRRGRPYPVTQDSSSLGRDEGSGGSSTGQQGVGRILARGRIGLGIVGLGATSMGHAGGNSV